MDTEDRHTAHMPSFSRMWLEPVPKDSSPQMNGVYLGVSMRFPKNFQPVGVSKQGMFFALHTKSSAHEVGIERAAALSPPYVCCSVCCGVCLGVRCGVCCSVCCSVCCGAPRIRLLRMSSLLSNSPFWSLK